MLPTTIVKDLMDQENLVIDGCDSALIGVMDGKAVYAWHLLVLHFMNEFSKDSDEYPCACESGNKGDCDCFDFYTQAVEWVDYNICGAYMGEGTPIVINLVAPYGGFTKEYVDSAFPLEYKGVNRLEDLFDERG